MKSSSFAIQIIPDHTIDEKYAAIIREALARIGSFTNKAVQDKRVGELFRLEKSHLDLNAAMDILSANGRLLVGFQFETRAEDADDNFRVFVKKQTASGSTHKFHLMPAVQQIILQLISLEDRRTVAIFSMLNISLEVGYRILTTLYGNQLKRLLTRVPPFALTGLTTRIERLAASQVLGEAEAWKTASDPTLGTGNSRPGSQDNILQVLTDDSLFDELNQYVGNIMSRNERIRTKRRQLEENPDIPKDEMYQLMVREDLDQLENCYARMHIYLKAFFKNKDKRSQGKNRILRQFFGCQIENIMAETGLLEDLVSLNEAEYFKNIDRHKEL
jgi:hypothetical protein